jgi:hypothetical protein
MSINLPIYNNEALASICLGHYLFFSREVSYAKAMLILPFVFHEQTAQRLRGNSKKRSLDEYILSNTDTLINFNKRYIDFLPIGVNAIMMLGEMQIIKVSSKNIFFNSGETEFNPQLFNRIGNRAKLLLTSVEGLMPILRHEEDWSAYLKLKIFL